MQQVQLAGKTFSPLGLGCWVFETQLWNQERENQLIQTMETALEQGVSHFDTASGYGGGSSESLLGKFLPAHREQVFLASKADLASSADGMVESVKRSLQRMQVDSIDLYYIHWPRSGVDLRPAMEGLERARRQGLLRAVGVSNFSAEQMAQVAEVGTIDAHQLGYNLLWRFPERDVLAYCREQHIPVITYGSLAQGILTGKFSRQLDLPPGDQRRGIVFFKETVWPHIYAAVEQLKSLAQEIDRPLQHLVIRWTLAQPGIVCALAGARSPQQVRENAAALTGEIPAGVLERMTAISDEALRHVPDQGNMYAYYP